MSDIFNPIYHISDVRLVAESNPVFGIYEHPEEGATIVCYAISDKNTFMGEFQSTLREFRGITFDRDGDIAARTMHKFFNVGENPESQPNVIPWEKINRVSTKHDGSMITPLILDGKLYCKTKRSFNCVEAQSATQYLYSHPELMAWVVSQIHRGFTPTFEWVSPNTPIVLTTYKKPELILLQIRNMITGKYENLANERPDGLPEDIRIAENFVEDFCDADGVVRWENFQEAIKNWTNIEGWVIQTTDGQMWKIKTEWYVACHKTVTSPRWRDFFYELRHGRLDDMRAAFDLSGRNTAIFDYVEGCVARKVQARMDAIKTLADEMKNSGLTGHDLFKVYNKNPHFTDANRMNRGTNIYEGVWKAWFQDMLPQISLNAISAELLADWGMTDEDVDSIVFASV